MVVPVEDKVVDMAARVEDKVEDKAQDRAEMIATEVDSNKAAAAWADPVEMIAMAAVEDKVDMAVASNNKVVDMAAANNKAVDMAAANNKAVDMAAANNNKAVIRAATAIIELIVSGIASDVFGGVNVFDCFFLSLQYLFNM